MLGTKTNSKSNQKGAEAGNLGPAGTATCIVSPGAVLEGKFRSKEDVRLDGRIEGDVVCSSRLVMGESGSVKGTVEAAEAVIMGRIEGDMVIHGSLSLKRSARIEGSISARTMSVEEGALYNGECRIGPEKG